MRLRLIAPFLLLGATACADNTASDPMAAQAFSFEVVKNDLAIDVELSGVFLAEDKDEIAMEPEAYRGDLIITSLLPEGASVKEGDILIEFDEASLEDSLEEANNEVEDKKVELAKAQAELKTFDIERDIEVARLKKEHEIAERDLAKARKELELEEEDKNKSVTDAEIRLADAKVDFEQLMQLYEERELHTATENILVDRDRRNLGDLERAINKTTREVALWKEFDRIKSIWEKELEVTKKDGEVRKYEIKVEADRSEKTAAVTKAERALKKAEEKVADLETDQSGLNVKSPRDGIVFYGTIGGDSHSDLVIIGMGSGDDEMRIGGRVRTHRILLTVASMENLSVKLRVLENDIQYMKPGLPVTIRPDAFPDLQIEGELTEVDQVASRTGFLSELREFTVKAAYEKVFPQLRSGMNCRVTVHADAVPEAVQVPVLAVFSEGGEYHCLVEGSGGTKKRPVKIGATNGTMVEITEGLRPGEKVSYQKLEGE